MRVDNSIDWERKLDYAQKKSGWEVFKYLYWGIYIFVIGGMLDKRRRHGPQPHAVAGWAAVLLAMFLVIYGFVVSLHHKLMKKHG